MNIDFDINKIKTPYYVVDENLIIKNLEILKEVSKKANCKILLAQKAFSMFHLYPLIGKYLDGTAASGLFEAKLGKEEMGGETHVFSTAYREDEFDEILKVADHIVFNSFNQWEKYKIKALKSNKEFGIRINPQFSTQEKEIYDPCAINSRLGVTIDNFNEDLFEGISGIHFHTLCEQDSLPLIETLNIIKIKFDRYLKKVKWVNFGGGHHITKDDYNREALIKAIIDFKKEYNVEVYLEPGEAIALDAGYLVTSVLDIVSNNMNIAILDTSAVCHMPDVIEMPYRPNIIGSDLPKEKKFTYRLAGPTCLAGDIIGDYSFDNELKENNKLIFLDMAIYSMVKNNTFNGINLPSIALVNKKREIKLIKEFGYNDFKNRLS